MHSAVFPENIVIPDSHPGWRAIVFQILRSIANNAAGMKLIVSADRRDTRDIHVRPDHAMRAELHGFVNHGVRPHANRGIQFRFRMNYCGGMNHRWKSQLLSIAGQARGGRGLTVAQINKGPRLIRNADELAGTGRADRNQLGNVGGINGRVHHAVFNLPSAAVI